MSAARQPLNHNAPDLKAAREFAPTSLRDAIDHWRSEVLRLRNRLDDAERFANAKFRPPQIDAPEIAGTKYRRAKTVLHYLLALDELQRAAGAQEPT